MKDRYQYFLTAVMASVLGVSFLASGPAPQNAIADHVFAFANHGVDFAPLPTVPLVEDAATIFGPGSRKKLLAVADNADELLPPDQAFTVSVSAKDANELVATFTPAKDYFLYRDKFVFRVQSPPEIGIANVTIPRGKIKNDPIFGKIEAFHSPVQVQIRLRRNNSSARSVMLYVRYQGCNEPLAVCYIPIEKKLRVTLPAAAVGG